MLLNISKIKELVVDFGKKEAKRPVPVYISRIEVKQDNSFRFLGIMTLVKEAQKRLCFCGNSRRLHFRAKL